MSQHKCPRYKRSVDIVGVNERPNIEGILIYENQKPTTSLRINRNLKDSCFQDYWRHWAFSSMESHVYHCIQKHSFEVSLVGNKPALDGMFEWHDWYADPGIIPDCLHALFRGRRDAFKIVAGLAPKEGGYRHDAEIQWAKVTFPDIGDLGTAKLGMSWQ